MEKGGKSHGQNRMPIADCRHQRGLSSNRSALGIRDSAIGIRFLLEYQSQQLTRKLSYICPFLVGHHHHGNRIIRCNEKVSPKSPIPSAVVDETVPLPPEQEP